METHSLRSDIPHALKSGHFFRLKLLLSSEVSGVWCCLVLFWFLSSLVLGRGSKWMKQEVKWIGDEQVISWLVEANVIRYIIQRCFRCLYEEYMQLKALCSVVSVNLLTPVLIGGSGSLMNNLAIKEMGAFNKSVVLFHCYWCCFVMSLVPMCTIMFFAVVCMQQEYVGFFLLCQRPDPWESCFFFYLYTTYAFYIFNSKVSQRQSFL